MKARALELDQTDPLAKYRERFHRPPGSIYMMGNSLGLMSIDAERCLERVVSEWAQLAIRGWLDAEKPWFYMAERIGASCAPLLGAAPNTVIATGTTTLNIHALVSSFYRPEGSRRKILADELNFPTDLYALQGQIELAGGIPSRDLLLTPSADGQTLDEDRIIDLMTDEVALIFLPTVLFSSGQRLDIETLTQAAHEREIIVGVDASHSAGVLRHDLDAWGVDFATWCSYKYLNGGPGASAFLYVNDRHREVRPRLNGWFGNVKERQFQLNTWFEPQPGAGGFQISSPGILGVAPLEGALDLVERAGIDAIEAKSRKATSLLIELVDQELRQPPYDFELATPREAHRRGGHVSIRRRQEAQRISKALRAAGVIADFRPPDTLRIAPAPLYNTYEEIVRTVQHIKEIIEQRRYEQFEEQPSIVP